MTEVVQEAPSTTDLEAGQGAADVAAGSPSWLSHAEAVVADADGDGEKLSLVPAAPPSTVTGASLNRKPTSGISLLSPSVRAAAQISRRNCALSVGMIACVCVPSGGESHAEEASRRGYAARSVRCSG
eukprot:COSAG02_NODE_2344_length_9101_cov_11.972117_9_plen_128_part_00